MYVDFIIQRCNVVSVVTNVVTVVTKLQILCMMIRAYNVVTLLQLQCCNVVTDIVPFFSVLVYETLQACAVDRVGWSVRKRVGAVCSRPPCPSRSRPLAAAREKGGSPSAADPDL